MKYQLRLLALLLPIFSLFAQNEYLPGTYTTSNGQTVEGYVLFEDWKAAPARFRFKKTVEGSTEVVEMNSVNELEVFGTTKYIKAVVNLDTSPTNVNNLTYNRNPMYEKRTLMLQVLSEGKANLYYYEGEGIERFYLSHNGYAIEPLIYKQYIIDSKIKENNRYKQQLINTLEGCEDITKTKILNTSYRKSPLSKIVDQYNRCSNVASVSYFRQDGSLDFNLNIKGGVGFSSYVIEGDGSTAGDYGSNTAYKLEVEAEAILPFNNNKLATFIGISKGGNYENTITVSTSSTVNPTQTKKFTYKQSFELPVGVRYYLFLTDDWKLSLHGGYNFTFVKEIGVEKSVTAGSDPSENIVTGNFIFGGGLHYNRFLLEARFELGKDLYSPVSLGFTSNNNVSSIVVGYSLF